MSELGFMRTILRQYSKKENVSHPESELKELIRNPASVLTIYRCIDQFSQEFIQNITRLVYNTPIPQDKQKAILKKFFDEDCGQEKFNDGKSDLAQFKLVNFETRELPDSFIQTYLEIVTNGLETNFKLHPQPNKKLDRMEREAKNAWKELCSHLMRIAQSIPIPDNMKIPYEENIMNILNSLLQTKHKRDREYFESNQATLGQYMKFILEDTNVQIERILLEYVKVAKSEKSHVAVVNFILTLSNLDITKMYMPEYTNGTQFEPWQKKILKDLDSLGMIKIRKYHSKQRKRDEEIFGITPILWQFCFRKIDLNILNAKIVIETNFNVYAYLQVEDQNDSTGQIEKLLSQFCDMHYKFPHLIVGQLSEAKTKESFKNGLTSKLLIQFFNKTSDPQMKKYLKDKQMNAIKLTQVQNLQKKKLEFLKLFQKTEDNFSLIPDNIEQEIVTWEKEKLDPPKVMNDTSDNEDLNQDTVDENNVQDDR